MRQSGVRESVYAVVLYVYARVFGGQDVAGVWLSFVQPCLNKPRAAAAYLCYKLRVLAFEGMRNSGPTPPPAPRVHAKWHTLERLTKRVTSYGSLTQGVTGQLGKISQLRAYLAPLCGFHF